MDKRRLLTGFLAQLEEELVGLRKAMLSTQDAATNAESKPENQYDTRALEASYLAGAQAKRIAELEEVANVFRAAALAEPVLSQSVAPLALVSLKTDGKPSKVLIMPKGGGMTCRLDGLSVQIVTPSSALGEAIVGMRKGDVTEFENGPVTRQVEITAIE
jgi:transcription elongation GreA/GreB family factor